jgi:hypothetical protein
MPAPMGVAVTRAGVGIAGITGGGTSWVYFGRWELADRTYEALEWRVLDIKSNDGVTPALFLMSEYALPDIHFDSQEPISNVWANSEIKAWCDELSLDQDHFKPREQAAILATIKDEAAYGPTFGPADLNGDRIFVPSEPEVTNAAYGFDEFKNDNGNRVAYDINAKEQIAEWWLRSPVLSRELDVADVTGAEWGVISLCRVESQLPVRPAFNLDSGKVLFPSAAVGGKPTEVVSGSQMLPYAVPNATPEWKLTLLDPAQAGLSVSAVHRDKSKLSITYTNAKTGTNQFLSAIILNPAGTEIVSYAKIADTSTSGNGTVTFALPDEFDREGFVLKLFSEQANGDYATDFASIPISVAVPTTPTITAVAGAGGSISPSGLMYVDLGATQQFKFTANPGYGLNQVFVDGVQVDVAGDTYTLGAYGVPRTIVATFEKAGTLITQAGYGGTIAGGGPYSVAADAGYAIDRLWVDGADISTACGLATYEVTTASQNITVTFAYTLGFNQPANGTLTVRSATGASLVSGSIVRGGDVITVTASPETGYELQSLIVNGVDVAQDYAGGYTYTVGTLGARRLLADGASVTGTQGAAIVAAFALATHSQSPENDITVFEVPGQVGGSVIDTGSHTVVFHMPAGSSVTAVQPAIEISADATITPASGAVQNFASPAEYTVTAENGDLRTWTVTCIVDPPVYTPSSARNITSFAVAGQTGSSEIDRTDHTVIFHVPGGTAITALAPRIGVSSGATVNPRSGQARDFSSPVKYTVTAEDGQPQEWTVTCMVDVALKGIEISALPGKATYEPGESLDLTGLVVTGMYTDGSTKVLTVTPTNVSGFDSSSPAKAQTLTATISGFTATFTVTVTDPAERDLEQAASLLTWETIRGSNLKPDEVTRDLNLVPQIGNGVALAWATDSPAVSAAGVMTRPDWNAGDVPVTLTATLTKAPAAAREVKFSVTVKKAAPPPVQVNAGVGGMTYTVNSQLVRFDGVTCFNAQRGISVMALRLFEQLGASFTYVWQPGGGVITMTYGGTTVVLRENSNQMTITDAVGTRTVTLRTAVVNRGGRAYIPTRDVSEYLGFNVVWNAADDSITITAK